MIYKKLRGGSAPPKNPVSQEPQKSFFKKIGNGITDSFRIFKKDFGNTASKFKKHIGNKASEFKTHFGEKASKLKTHINNKVSNLKTRIGNKAHTISLKAQVFSKKASLKLSEGIAQAKKIKYIIPGRDPINLTNIELKKQKLKNLTHELEIIAEQKKNKKDSSKKAINAIAQIKKDSKKIKNIMAPHSKILGLNIRKINEYNQIKKILNKKLNNNKIHTKIDNHTKLEDTHKKKLQKLFHNMTRKYVPQASITKSILSLGISPLLNVYERRKRASELINLDKSTETGQKEIINKIKQIHDLAQTTSLEKHETQFKILDNNIELHENMKKEIENIKEATRKIHEDYLEKQYPPTDSDKNAYNNAIKNHKIKLNSTITAYIKAEENARKEYKITQKQPLYMLPKKIQNDLEDIRKGLLNKQATQKADFNKISTTRIMHEALTTNIKKKLEDLQKQKDNEEGYMNIYTDFGLPKKANSSTDNLQNTLTTNSKLLQNTATQARAKQLENIKLKYSLENPANTTTETIKLVNKNAMRKKVNKTEYLSLNNLNLLGKEQELYNTIQEIEIENTKPIITNKKQIFL